MAGAWPLLSCDRCHGLCSAQECDKDAGAPGQASALGRWPCEERGWPPGHSQMPELDCRAMCPSQRVAGKAFPAVHASGTWLLQAGSLGASSRAASCRCHHRRESPHSAPHFEPPQTPQTPHTQSGASRARTHTHTHTRPSKVLLPGIEAAMRRPTSPCRFSPSRS